MMTTTNCHTPVAGHPRRALELLGDEYACRIIGALDGEQLSASTLVERCEMSRPTVYRRLDRLEDAGLVDVHTERGHNGQEHRQFSLAVEEIQFQVDEDGISGQIASAQASD